MNYREDIFASAEEARRIYSAWLERADILKLSDDEADLFFGEERERSLLRLSEGRKGLCYAGQARCAAVRERRVHRAPDRSRGDGGYDGCGRRVLCGRAFRIDAGENDAGRLLLYANVCGAIATEPVRRDGGAARPRREVRERLNG